MVMALFFLLNLILLLFSCDVSSLLSCFTDHCPGDNTSLCLTICPRTYEACFRNTTAPPSLHFELPRLGCSRLDCRIDCDYEEYDIYEGGEYCCCTSDYCNVEFALAHLIIPKFNYHLPSLDQPSLISGNKVIKLIIILRVWFSPL